MSQLVGENINRIRNWMPAPEWVLGPGHAFRPWPGDTSAPANRLWSASRMVGDNGPCCYLAASDRMDPYSGSSADNRLWFACGSPCAGGNHLHNIRVFIGTGESVVVDARDMDELQEPLTDEELQVLGKLTIRNMLRGRSGLRATEIKTILEAKVLDTTTVGTGA